MMDVHFQIGTTHRGFRRKVGSFPWIVWESRDTNAPEIDIDGMNTCCKLRIGTQRITPSSP